VTTAELQAKLVGRSVVASVSGGKDSAATSLWLMEQGIEHDRVFLNTGWENAATYNYLRGPLTDKLGPIKELRTDVSAPPPEVTARLRPLVRAAVEAGSAMVRLVLKKGLFPARTIRFCTQELKLFPMQKYIRERADAGDDIVNAVGIRRAESEARARMAEWEHADGFDCEVWRPLVSWSEQDVIDIHHRHGLRPNPLYLAGASRVGCWPCIHARKGEIRRLAEVDPERVELIRQLELDVADLARKRIEARGETMENPPGFFQAPIGRRKGPDGKVVHVGTCWPIDRVVTWSKTIRGGKEEDRQELLFADDSGCMRWGLCDTAGATA
jgi:3'-phosphoadenosine 5'-phosphosulfate sulfotransferase (PAPS reductase)/FAD synthetase